MQNIFISTYKLFERKKSLFVITLMTVVAFIGFFLSKLSLEENINAIIPNDSRINNINRVLNNTKLSDRIILTFSLADSSQISPDILKNSAEHFVEIIKKDTHLIADINFRIESNSYHDIYEFFYNNLPFYLEESDYSQIRSLLCESEIKNTLEKDFKSLISPAGIATKAFIFKDPLNITPLALKKLQDFQLDDNFIVFNSCIYTKNKKNLLVFVEPKYSSSNTNMNATLIDSLNRALNTVSESQKQVNVEYYGGTAVAVANASRIKNDIKLTVSVAFLIIFILFFLFFRQLKVLLLLFIPVILGAGIAISLLVIFIGNISAISLGVGAVLIGISIDFSLHAFTHYRHSGSIEKTLNDISLPILMSSLTTASAFLCLFIVKSSALNQLGLFAALSVIFSALVVLFIIPVFFTGIKSKFVQSHNKPTFLDKIAAYSLHKNKLAISIVFLLSLVFLFTSKNINFNSEIASLNYMPNNLAIAEKNLEAISSETQSAVYLVTLDRELENALVKTENQLSFIDSLNACGIVSSKSSGAELLLSTQMQKQKIKKWNVFWDTVGREHIEQLIKSKGKELRFKENAFNQFYNLINKDFKPIALDEFSALQKTFLSNYINTTDSLSSVISVLKVDSKNKDRLFELVESHEDLIVFDKQFFSNQFFDVLKENFDKLVILSIIIVFVILLVFLGRIELALITFVPIILSWLWTLGLMGLFNIEFNIFNIIISTFIFGLGIDYSIFIVKGLLNNYKFGNRPLTPYKLSVLLSVITTILGVGVLIFAKHPALKSIALVSILGITSVLIISYTLLPLLFNFITTQKGKTRTEPITFGNSLISVLSFVVFLVDTIILTLIIPVLIILPLPRKQKKYFYHFLIYITSKVVVLINVTIKKNIIDAHKVDFSKPSIIVSNHQSHLDLVLLLMQHPKIIVITNKWVWNNPFYGFVVRFADYFPIYKGIETGFDKIQKKVNDGYSILVFPEGSRTFNGKVSRYHQGAFKLASDLNLKLQPVLIHGAFQCLPKTDFFLRSGSITIKYFDAVEVQPANLENNETYRLQAKELTKLVREKFQELQLERETPSFYAQKVINQYVYKGPVNEWYVRVKLKLENNYEFFNSLIPRKAKIVDIGCGYGYFAFMLRSISDQREITGIDYDEEKIQVAQKISAYDEGLSFVVQDIVDEDIPDADVYVLKDVLHYMPENLQLKVLNKCIDKLPKHGMIIVRDADSDLVKRTKVTRNTEIQSTKIFKFNKTNYNLTFISGKKIMELAESKGLVCERHDNSKWTSNITYIIKNA